MQKGKSTRAEIANRTIERVKRFSDQLESGIPVSEFYSCRKVVLNVELKAYDAESVKRVRNILQASQRLFAQFLNVSVSTVQKWERGENTPEGSACRLMDEIANDPEYWKKRFRSMMQRVECPA